MGALQGHYYRKQLGCDCRLIAWSHKSRFDTAVKSLGMGSPRVLDYGCGDGTFLLMAQHRISLGVGADIATQQIIDCKARFADIPNVRFCTVSELVHEKHLGAYDVVNCMETLEHCPHPVVDNVIRDLVRFVKPEGQVVISVPIETGLTFLGKTIIRKLAAMRNLSDYRYYESYSFTNALRMIFANRRTALTRPVYGGPENPSHSHYGFNWRTMRDRVKQHLTLEEIRFSPLGWLGGALSSQAWFICRPYTSTQRPDPNGIRERFIRIPA